MVDMEKTIRGSSIMTSRGQITVPYDLREKYDMEPGDVIYFIEMNGYLVLEKGPIKLGRDQNGVMEEQP